MSRRARILRIEELVSSKLSAQQERKRKLANLLPTYARRHATVVAAIALAGEPKTDEPLIRAWARALQHYKIVVHNPVDEAEQVRAAQLLDPIILGEQNSSSRFAEIFRTTPPWLLQFTRTVLDAWILKFHLPQMRPHSNWGTEGLSDAEHWPFLPSGVLTAGEPIPDKDVRQLVVAVQSIVPPAGHVPNIVDQLAGVANDSSRDDRTTLDDIAVALSLGEKPSEEWSAYEKRRMRQLVRTMSRDD